jgi:TetR/AcrR family transcriptional repressor of mexJK operon
MRSRSEKTRMIIVDAAKHLFLDNGYDNTTLDDIAKSANTTKRTIYGYFADKHSLFLYVVESLIGIPWVFSNPVKDITTKDDLYLVLFTIAKGLNEVYSNPEYEQLIRVCIAEVSNYPEINSILDRGITRRSLALLITVMETADKRGIVPIGDLEFKARSFVGGLLVGFYTDGLFTPHPIVPKPYTDKELMAYVATNMPS